MKLRLVTPFLIIPIALLLTLPSLWNGLQFDDYVHQPLIVAADNLSEVTTELFAFLENDSTATKSLIEQGVLPWWTLPDVHISFWRPLTALTHWLDYQFWPNSPFLMHLHSLLWFAAVILVVSLLYRRFISVPHITTLAIILYAVDEAHGFPVGWLAHRNTLLAMFFSGLALLMYDKWRRDKWGIGGWLAPFFFLLGVFSAEAAIAMAGYFFAYTLFLDKGILSRRLLSLLPTITVIVGWLTLYRWLGYGTWGTAYANPIQEPLRFLWLAIERAPLLLLGQLTPIPAELYNFLFFPWTSLLWVMAVSVVIGLIVAMRHLWTTQPEARFFTIGLFLSLPPSCIILPANRLLFFIGFGAMGVIALYLGQTGAWWRPLGLYLGISHLILAPIFLPVAASAPAMIGNLEPAIKALPQGVSFSDQTLVIVNAPTAFYPAFIFHLREQAGQPTPKHIRLLSSTIYPVKVSRPDARTLIVRPTGGYLLGFDSVFRGRGHDLQPGDTIHLMGMTAIVEALATNGQPAQVRFQFEVPLEDNTLHWVIWHEGQYVPFNVPDVGGKVKISSLWE